MNAKQMTHKGMMRGCDNRTPDGYSYPITLRETANFWIDKNGKKYRKRSGTAIPAESWPLYRLDVDSVKPI